MENWKHVDIETSLKKVECGMLREMRYAKSCGLIIPGEESSTLNICRFIDVNAFFSSNKHGCMCVCFVIHMHNND